MTKMWFKQKRYGYGAGLPISWEGWVLCAVYVSGVTGIVWYGARLEPADADIFRIAGVLILTGILLLIAHAKTEGGWRWRWGGD